MANSKRFANFATSLGGCYSRGLVSPILLPVKMITEKQIQELIESHILGSGIFLVEVVVKQGNAIRIQVDRKEGISIDECVKISRFVNENLDRDEEDYSLEVSSPGLGKPFKVRQQYEKSIGKRIEISLTDGKREEGILEKVGPDSIWIRDKEGELDIPFNEINKAKEIISFN